MELGFLLEKILPYLKKRKAFSLILYIFFLFYFSLPAFQIPLLEYQPTYVTSLMEQRAIEHAMIFYPQQSWASFGTINQNLFRAIVSMEDGNFFNHKGVDWEELEKSMRLNKRRRRAARGGSTITMQLAKNLYYTTNKSVFRKAKELLTTFRIEKEVSKKGIIHQYVNIIEWGDGVLGIEEAANKYFGKEPDAITTNECAKLAAVIPSPLVHQPNVNSNYVRHRSAIIRGRLGDVILFPEK